MSGEVFMKFSNWNEREVKDLFDEVEICKQSKYALKMAFDSHAKKYNRKPNSVRNYYYHEVDNLLQDEKRCQKLGVDINKHIKNHFDNFDKEEEEKLFEQIEKLTKQGISVRSACLKLSGGDLTEMTRLQNKYQNMKKKLGVVDNVIPFKQRQKILTESDINSLFMGLVRLIKKTAVEDFMEKSKLEKESSSYLLKKAFVDLNKKDKQIAELREGLQGLKEENAKLISRINALGESKQESLKQHLLKKKLKQTLES